MWDFPRFPVEDSAADQLLSSLPSVPGDGREQQQQSLQFDSNVKGSAAADALRGNLQEQLTGLCGVTAELCAAPGEFRHSVTRYRIRLICLTADCTSVLPPPEGETVQWYEVDELPDLPLSTSGRRMARLLAAR